MCIRIDLCGRLLPDAYGDMSWAHAGREDSEFAAWVSGNASSGTGMAGTATASRGASNGSACKVVSLARASGQGMGSRGRTVRSRDASA
jgi:hypothetical protein